MNRQNKQRHKTAGARSEAITTDKNSDKKSRKNLIIIASSISASLLIIFLVIQFINSGGFSGIRIRKRWNQIESFLNRYTNDNFKIISQDSNMLKISFDEGGLLDFFCREPSIFNMGYSSPQCSFKYYYNGQTTDRLGRYYLLKNLQKVDELIESAPGLAIVDERFDDYRRVSFDEEKQLKQFFDKLTEIEDFKNTWEVYKKLIAANGKIQETQSVNENNPTNIIDPNGIFLDIVVRKNFDHVISNYESLFDYAYRHNW